MPHGMGCRMCSLNVVCCFSIPFPQSLNAQYVNQTTDSSAVIGLVMIQVHETQKYIYPRLSSTTTQTFQFSQLYISYWKTSIQKWISDEVK